jgi:hypothetical protein
LIRLAKLKDIDISDSSSSSTRFKKERTNHFKLNMVRNKYPDILKFDEIKQVYLKIFFEKFYSISGYMMIDIIKKNNQLKDVLNSQPLSHQILKKYHHMLKMENLYCHFFKDNTKNNDEIIQIGMVKFI